jgi:nitrile hydratase
LPPITYLSASYYQRWFLGLERRLEQFGLVGADEVAAGHSLRPAVGLNRKMTASEAAQPPTRGNYERPAPAPARFKVGDIVRARNITPTTHTRLPRYARGKLGLVEAIRGCHVYPDTAALGQGDDPQWLYTVVFTGRELWGEDADPTIKVSIEAFEPYLTLA